MPVKTRFLTTFLLILLIFPARAAASEHTAKPFAGLFFVEEVSSPGFGAVNLLLFCDTVINEDTEAIFIAIGGSMDIRANIRGAVLRLFTKTVSTGAVKYGIINLKLLLLPAHLLAGVALIAVFRDFYEQSAAYFEKNKASVFKFGLYGYLMALLLIGIYFVSVSGAAVALAGLAALAAAAFAGHVPVSVVLGYNMLKRRASKYNIYMLFIAGSAVIDVFTLLPFAGDALLLAVKPLVSLGVFSVLIIHRSFYRAYVSVSFEKADIHFDRKKINSVILRSVNKTDMGGVENE